MKPRSTGAAGTAALLACMAMLAQAGQTAQDQELLDREMALAAQLRCVVCQNQTVAESRAPMAEDMRREIRSQLEQGHSNEQVIAFFEQRYGAFVRYNPPWKPSTWLLWSSPSWPRWAALCCCDAHCAAGACRTSR
jgi:cytochrome c-type biogenesis protein CcmH